MEREKGGHAVHRALPSTSFVVPEGWPREHVRGAGLRNAEPPEGYNAVIGIQRQATWQSKQYIKKIGGKVGRKRERTPGEGHTQEVAEGGGHTNEILPCSYFTARETSRKGAIARPEAGRAGKY